MKKIIYYLSLIIFCANVSAQGLYIGSSATLSGGSSAITVKDGAFTNNGTFSAGTSTVNITGSATKTNSTIGGTSTSTFNNLTINKASNDAALGNNIVVQGNLTMTSGNLDLNTYTADLQTTGVLMNETNTTRVYGDGSLTAQRTLNAPASANPANLGAELTSAQNLGSTTITRTHTSETNNSSGTSILRSYNIQPTNNSGLNATLKFYYFDVELNGITESALILWRSTDNGVTWTQQVVSAADAVANWIQVSNINAFSKWTASSYAAFPIELISFVGFNRGDAHVLNWLTAVEENFSHFEVMRSANGVDYETMGAVNGKGISGTGASYSYIDTQPYSGMSYYQLRMVDIDGKVNLSNVVTIRWDKGLGYAIYPNPSKGKIAISSSGLAGNTTFKLFDAQGKETFTHTWDIANNQIQDLDLSALSEGVYFYEINHRTHTQQGKIVLAK